MAGIIAHTVGVIAAAGGDPSEIIKDITVGQNGNLFGWELASTGSISPNNDFFSGEELFIVSYSVFSDSWTVRTTSDTPAQNLFAEVEFAYNGGTLTLTTAGATFFEDGVWNWDDTTHNPATQHWDAADIGETYEVIFRKN